MRNFDKIGEALQYIDDHLDEPVCLETLADQFYLSHFYFHRIFSAIVGKPLASYIRDRRILYASRQLHETNKSILEIALNCGFQSAQSFSRAFLKSQGQSPSLYRKSGNAPVIITARELVMKFTNRLRGGIVLSPNLIKREAMLIAGTCGDGDKTWEVWNDFEKLSAEKPLGHVLSQNGYEIRTFDGTRQRVHVGYPVSAGEQDPAYQTFALPASEYASFDVYVANGYDSENSAMNQWLETNPEGYREKLLKEDCHYVVEYYDQRFQGEESGSIVEIWVPIEIR